MLIFLVDDDFGDGDVKLLVIFNGKNLWLNLLLIYFNLWVYDIIIFFNY